MNEAAEPSRVADAGEIFRRVYSGSREDAETCGGCDAWVEFAAAQASTVSATETRRDALEIEVVRLRAEVARLSATPLPPEPPFGAWVLTGAAIGEVFIRGSAGWASPRWPPMTWPDLLQRHGPVRLLGDPIEAPEAGES